MRAARFQIRWVPFDPAEMGHGEHGPASLPAGDIPNFVLTAKADETAHTSVVAPNVTQARTAIRFSTTADLRP